MSLTVRNTSSQALTNVHVTDNLPDGWQTTTGKKTLDLTAGDLKPGEGMLFKVQLTASSPGQYENRARASTVEGASAEALAKSVSDPASPSYGKYLTPAQFRKRFAPTQAEVSTVQSWLKAQGFTVVYTPTNNHYVAAEGTVAQAATAFGTTFGMYTVKGKSERSPNADVSIPTALAGVVTSVIGLDESAVIH
jgi:hypothetical protein